MELVNLDSEYRVIGVAGEDARGFLQAQMTCDLLALDEDCGCLGGVLTPKGKVLTSALVLPFAADERQDWLLLTHPQVADRLLTHLSRYVLRAKVSLGPVDLSAVGLLTQSSSGPDDFSRLPGTGKNHFVLPDGRHIGVSESAVENTDSARWKLMNFEAGLVSVNEALYERFIPQMLGLDAIGGVSFSKGCYPGQEIVARAKHLGRVKRGLALVQSERSLEVGQDLALDSGGRAGEVIDVLATGAGWMAQAVINRDAEALADVQLLKRF